MGTLIGFVALLSFYGLLLTSGMWLASLLQLRTALGKSLMTITFGAAQLLVSMQLLSFFRGLNDVALFLVNAALTLCVKSVLSARSGDQSDLPVDAVRTLWSAMLVSFVRRHRYESAILMAAFAIIIWFTALGFLVFPMTDTYHFAMPLFWKQHATMLPYPVANPRLTSVVFASEALCFPGQLYLRTNAMFLVVSALALLVTIWTVVTLAMDLGASLRAAIITGVTLVGYGATVYSLTGGSPEVLVAAMWFAGSLYFLLESRSSGKLHTTTLGCSVLCLLMACGAKNVVVLQLPAYAIGAALLLGRDAIRPRSVTVIAIWAAAGLVCSSVLWSYTSNLLWFGRPQGHVVLSDTVSKDVRPVAVWTRVSRMTIAATLDPLWLPASLSQPYKGTIRKLVSWTGARETLPEDSDEYYSFSDENLRPGRGLSALGLLVLIPGVLAGIITTFGKTTSLARHAGSRTAFLSLLVITTGSFLAYYALLKWQPFGITRMMLSCIVGGLPLSFVLLEKRKWQVFSMAVILLSVAVFSVYALGMVSRRAQLSPTSKIAQALSRLQHDRSEPIECQWANEEPRLLTMRENYSLQEIYELFMSRVPESAAIGVVGGTNTDEYFFFGKAISHNVVPLVDCRSLGQFFHAPEGVDYVAVQDFDADSVLVKNFPEFSVWLRVKREGKTTFVGLRRKNPDQSGSAITAN